jgi:gamma-glutamyl-gamma-aminobutyrate hydrolase PuuD
MKRIGLTQRVELAASHGERRDCLDQRWGRLLVSRGLTPVPLCNGTNDVTGYLEALGLHGLILTGGNDIDSLASARDAVPERDRFERGLLAFGSERGLPILGVCRGAQMLSLFHGGALSRVAGHVARRHPVTRLASELASPAGLVARGWPTRFEVNSYHSFSISPDSSRSRLVPLALADDGSVEAIGHVELPQIGILWHPERESPFVDGPLDILQSFFLPDRPTSRA